MILCKVTGSVIATRKDEKLTGCKFLVVEPLHQGSPFVAVDNVGAGVDEIVLVVYGSGARAAYPGTGVGEAPIDAAIVGIVDEGTYKA